MRERDDEHDVVRRGRLKRRAEFLRVGDGRKWHGSAMTIQCDVREAGVAPADRAPRFGFTLTKRVGNAVVRNRARRRLREAVRLAPATLPARDLHDYVIVGRIAALRLPFDALARELARGLDAVHEQRRRPGKAARPARHARPSGEAASSIATGRDEPPARAAPDRIEPQP